MSATVSIDFSRFNSQVERYITQLHQAAPDVIKTQARLFLQQAMKFTPPKTLAQGAKAAGSDVDKVIMPMPGLPGGYKNSALLSPKVHPSLVRMANAGDAKGIQKLLANLGWNITEGGDDVVNWGGDQIKAWHESKKRRGVVPGKHKSWNSSRKMVLHGAPEYRKRVQSHVGRLKAGFAPAVSALGGNVPAWVSRHAAGARGYVRFDLAQKNNPSITIENHAAGSSKIAHHVRGAMEVRVRSMEKDLRVKLGQAARIF